MLEGLDAIDWAAWETAYGPADPVPAHLAALAGGSDAEAAAALRALKDSVGHQGLAAPAAVPAIPFLVAIGRARPSAPLVTWIADLGCGGSHHFVADGEPLPDVMAGFLRPVRAAVAGAFDLFDALLDHRDAQLRSAAAIGLGTAFEHVPAARARLADRLPRERSAPALATMVCALGRLAREDHHAATAGAVAPFLGHRTPAVALAARIAAAQADPTPARLRELLAIARPGPPAKGVAWVDGALDRLAQQLAITGLAAAGDVDSLAAAVDRIGIRWLARPLLAAALGPPRPPGAPLLRREEIPASAVPVLDLIARHFPPPTTYGAAFDAPEAWGLASLPRLLGVVPARPLDRSSDGDPVWWTALEVRAGRRPPEAWRAVVGGLSAEDRLDLLRDLCTTPRPYRLDQPLDPRTAPTGWDAGPLRAAGFAPLVQAVATALPTTVLLDLLRDEEVPGYLLLPVLDELSARAPIPDDLDDRVADIVDVNGGDLAAARRVVGRLDPARAERLVLGLYPDLLVTTHADGVLRPAVRGATPFADLAPTAAVREQHAAWLATRADVAFDLPASFDGPIAEVLAPILAAFGPGTGARLAEAAREAAALGRDRWVGILGRVIPRVPA